MRNIILMLLFLLCSSDAAANVLRVEKNGSGDFTIIQQAVDASASGDTILIGPGRYDDKFLWGTPPWQQYARVLVTRADLTLIGAGADQTIIGDAAPMSAGYDQDSGLAAHAAFGAGVVRIADIGFENCYNGAYFVSVELASVAGCRFAGNGNSITSRVANRVEVEECTFQSLTEAYSFAEHVLASGPGAIAVTGSVFTISRPHRYSGGHMHLQQMTESSVLGCTFTGGAIGVNATLGSGVATIANCRFDDQINAGIIHSMYRGTVRVVNTTMGGQYKALWATDYDPRWEVEGLVVEDAFEYSLVFAYLGSGFVRNSRLAKGTRFAVFDAGGLPRDGVVHFDMMNNWWGTDDPDSIQAWIFDGNDQPERPYFFIDWSPFMAEPTAAEARSLGGVKSMFR